MRLALVITLNTTTPTPPRTNGNMCRIRVPETNIMRNPTAPITITEPKSGSNKTGSAMMPMSIAGQKAPRINSSTRQLALSSQTASKITVSIFANSLG